jgi:hypothetical protein
MGEGLWVSRSTPILAFGISIARAILLFGRPGDLAGAQKFGRKLLKSMDVHTIYLMTLYCVSAADLDKAYSVIDEAADMLALVDHWVPTGLRLRPLLEA